MLGIKLLNAGLLFRIITKKKKGDVVPCPKHFFFHHTLLLIAQETRTTKGTRLEKDSLFRSANSSHLCSLHLDILNALAVSCIFFNSINNKFEFIHIYMTSNNNN
jgi:hypothetical protein